MWPNLRDEAGLVRGPASHATRRDMQVCGCSESGHAMAFRPRRVHEVCSQGLSGRLLSYQSAALLEGLSPLSCSFSILTFPGRARPSSHASASSYSNVRGESCLERRTNSSAW